jgi:NAD(P)-dependent dehydrogenase (short-subunit alcohol dehydrogenase family)
MALLDGRVVVVTGGGRGLGRAHSLELASHGATVVVNDLPSETEDPAEDVVREIADAGGTALADRTSVSDFEGTGKLVARVVEELGRLDGVVNNAGITRDKMLTGMAESDFDAVIDVHLKGTFNLTHHAANHWRALAKAGTASTGRIVNTTSGAGLWGNVGQINYAAAKAGIIAMTTVTAMELERYGVTANVVSPIARTRMSAGLDSWQAPVDGFDRLDPANTSPVVAWLLSEQSGWLTGAVLRVEGDTVLRVNGFQTDDATRTRTGAPEHRLDATKLDTALRRAYGLLPGGVFAQS